MASQAAPLVQWVLEHPIPIAFIGAVITIRLLTSFLRPSQKTNDVPHLPETIPFLSNAYQYMTDMTTFLSRSRAHLAQSPIFQFRIGPMNIYMVTTARNIQVLFRNSPAISPDKFLYLIYDHVAGFAPGDMARIKADRTGRLRTPAGVVDGKEGGSGSVDRYFYPMHGIVHEHLVQAHKTDALALRYQALFEDRLAKRFPLSSETGQSEWITARVYHDLLLQDMTAAATGTLAGTRILETEPDLTDIMWEMDEIAAKLVWGLPKWMNRSAWRKRDALLAACRRHVEREWEGFDWEGEERDWEPVWGASVTRESLRWMKEGGFEMATLGGTVAVMYIFG